MRCFLVSACALLTGALVSGLAMPLPLSAEELPQYTVRRAEEAKADSPAPGTTESLDLDLVFPLSQLPQSGKAAFDLDPRPTSRRNGMWRQFWPQAQAEPGLFSPDEDRPLKPLWTPSPLWQPEPGIITVAGEEPLDVAAEKCAKCGKCDACKCANCPGKECKGETPLEHGETAKVILELMETLGRSVLDGTVFQKPDQADQEWLKELSADGQVSPREALIQYIRHLEAQETRGRDDVARREEVEIEFEFVSAPLATKSPCGCPVSSCPAACHDCPAQCAECRDCPADASACLASADQAPCLHDAAGSEVDVLREMSAHLEMAANELERREIYQRADQLREVAGQLRQDARRSSLARAARKKAPAIYSQPQPHQDVQAQLHELREELHRTRVQLEQARQRPYPPYESR